MAHYLTLQKKIDARRRFISPCGCRDSLDKMLYIDDNGNERLRVTGKTDNYALIQSHRDSCDLSIILRNIDPRSLNNAISSFNANDLLNSPITDISSMPSSLGGLYNLIQDGHTLFNGLPEPVRAEFNYSVKNFVDSFGTPRFTAVVSKFVNSKDPKDPKESTESEDLNPGGDE